MILTERTKRMLDQFRPFCGVYMIQSPSGKRYVGSSVDIRNRISQHASELRHNKHNNRHLQNAWNKHNGELTATIIFMTSRHILLAAEQSMLDDLRPEYNIAKSTTAPGLGIVPSEETRNKKRIASTGKKCSEETKEKLRQINLGHRHTDEAREKIRQAGLGRKQTDSSIEKSRQARLGQKRTAEAREKMSQAQQRRPRCTDETREKMRLAQLARNELRRSQ